MIDNSEIIDVVDENFVSALGSMRHVFRIAVPYLDEDDLLQEARFAVLSAVSRGHYDESRDLRPWAIKVAKNALRDLLGRHTASMRVSKVEGMPVYNLPLSDETACGLEDPEEAFEAVELEELANRFVDALLGALRGRHRKVLECKIRPPAELGEAPTIAEVACHLGVKSGVIKYSLSRADERAERLARLPEYVDLN